MPVATGVDPFATVIGQEAAVRALRAAASAPVHAYLLVGPTGSGSRRAARAFAAELLGVGLDGAERERVVRLALDEQHADLIVIEPDGNIFRFPKEGESPGRRLVKEATTSPREAARKVVVAVDFHLAEEAAVGKLLKVVEEPPATTVLVLLEEHVPPEQATIESRCVRIDFGPVPAGVLAEHLVAEVGVAAADAELLAEAARGDVDRARLLATDADIRSRYELWRSIPNRLDGSGAAVVQAVRAVESALEVALAPVKARQERELEELNQLAQERGTERGLGRCEVAERHKREQRQWRTDELRFGLATLAVPYRVRLATAGRPAPLVASLRAIQSAAEALERNPIEALLLEALFLQLEPLRGRPA